MIGPAKAAWDSSHVILAGIRRLRPAALPWPSNGWAVASWTLRAWT